MEKRFLVLDSFRGLCALAVVCYHIHIISSFTELSFFRESWILVEFFFVLSGFVMAHGYSTKSDLRFTDFIISRTFRLFPLHIVMLIVFIIIEIGKFYAYKKGLNFHYAPFTGPGALKEILPNLLLIQSWSPFTSSQSFNYTAWSISVEFYTYLIFFVTITMFKKHLSKICWIVISALMFYLLFTGSHLLVSPVKRGLSCFFAGSLTYTLYTQLKVFSFSRWLYTTLELLSVILIFVVVSYVFPHRGIVVSLLFCLTILVFSFEGGLVSSLFKHPYFLRIGQLSYSMYMTQAAIIFLTVSIMMVLHKTTSIAFTSEIDGRRFLNFGNPVLNNLSALITIFMVIIISSITYKYIEKTGQQFGKKILYRINRNRL